MAWRLAKALVTLRDQVNALSPNRRKESDGTIGNAEHAARTSDHNPWVMDGNTGIVTGMDLTNDPAHGIDSERIAEALRVSGDTRLKYIISNRKIASVKSGWAWLQYDGKNPHNHHVHISVKPEKASYDSTVPFVFQMKAPTAVQVAKPVTRPANPVLTLGAKGPDVERLQKLLIGKGAKITVDSTFGPKTQAAVLAFQRANKMVADGSVGASTWEVLLA